MVIEEKITGLPQGVSIGQLRQQATRQAEKSCVDSKANSVVSVPVLESLFKKHFF